MEILAPKGPASGAILVIHSWWGLTDSFRDYGSMLTEEGYLVGLADLFFGEVAKTADHAKALRARRRQVPIYRTLGSDTEELRSHLSERHARIGIAGFSMGGHWAVWLSQRPEYAITATVLYYAARAGDFSACSAAILAHFAEADSWVSASSRKTMEKAIRAAGCPYGSFDYPNTRHWFAEASRPDAFNADASRIAFGRDRDHFAQYLSH